ncbi:BTAD domain-containing putative transcriptional regulator [Nocardioides sp. CFH 31398]|uniref:AfsR/SARP family transcriptional regulator n=1 Tax=Nocardioides sp. CFH 31398 TaxID=2919579 RepID=UPI001F0618EF|nr:BTAD domain-containing putative transcriptional regulator [Nocardioides sp. CFH 31398]MCH1868825.1 hypothetical protein [Nocardioides sp. CFH 31398]
MSLVTAGHGSPEVVTLDGWCRLTLLGEFRLEADGDPPQVGAVAERLLAMLAITHRRRRVRRTAIAERLWPDAPAGRATASLRSTLWRMPRPRGRALVQGNATSVWLADGMAVDLWAAEDLAHDLAGPEGVDHADRGLDLLREDLLADWVEDWLVLEQESHRQTRLRALELGASLLWRHGRRTAALEAAMAAVRAEPLRESAHRAVIEVHLAENNLSEALRQYDGYRRLLADELGLRPTETIRSLVAPLLGRPVDAPGGGPDGVEPASRRAPGAPGRIRTSAWPLH